MPAFAAITPDSLAELVAERAVSTGRHPVRLGLDAPEWVPTEAWLARLAGALLARGRPLAVIAARDFLRDASLRLEHGRNDVESYYAGWLDAAALEREVLLPLAETGHYLPSLRDPVTNRATRAEPVSLPANAVAVLTGPLLLAQSLSVDYTVHLAVSRAARRRQAPAELAWTLPAYDRYDLELDPIQRAELAVRWDDPQRPAVRASPGR